MERRGRTELEGLVLRYIDESEALKGANVGVYFEVRRSTLSCSLRMRQATRRAAASHSCNAHAAGRVTCGPMEPLEALVLSPQGHTTDRPAPSALVNASWTAL